jgi:hypothetical protein
MDNADETALPREVGQETRVAAQPLAFEFYTGFLAQKKAEFSLKTRALESGKKTKVFLPCSVALKVSRQRMIARTDRPSRSELQRM